MSFSKKALFDRVLLFPPLINPVIRLRMPQDLRSFDP
ncbi:hypothetical protein PM8797T_20154 [Gimesia maris DSM 8797]|nr:hypothetical protein PM8797T_20154 [Gimesia maris DSM 8797]